MTYIRGKVEERKSSVPQSGGLPLEASSSPSSSSLSHTRAGSDAFRPSEYGWEEAALNNKEQTCRTNNNIEQNLQLDKIIV